MRILKDPKQILVPVLLLMGLCFMECKKKKEAEPEEESPVQEAVPPAETSASEYSQLKVGNYWIYEVTYWLNVSTPNPSDTTAHSGMTDSCYVSKDTLINGRRFFEVRNTFAYNNFIHRYLKDSLSYIVDSKFGILFSSHYFNTPIKDWFQTNTAPVWAGDTVYHGEVRMIEKGANVTVPAGTFSTYNAQVTRNYMNLYSDPRKPNPRRSISKYAKNTGMVYEFTSDGTIMDVERKLLRYHLN